MAGEVVDERGVPSQRNLRKEHWGQRWRIRALMRDDARAIAARDAPWWAYKKFRRAAVSSDCASQVCNNQQCDGRLSRRDGRRRGGSMQQAEVDDACGGGGSVAKSWRCLQKGTARVEAGVATSKCVRAAGQSPPRGSSKFLAMEIRAKKCTVHNNRYTRSVRLSMLFCDCEDTKHLRMFDSATQ